MWGYWWGYTIAEIELMSVDQPLIIYHNDKDNKKPKKANPLDVIRAQKEWLDKYGDNPDQKIKIDFTQFNIGNKQE